MKFKWTWLLYGLWALALFLMFYQGSNEADWVHLLYSISFYGALILSFVYLMGRAQKQRSRK